MPKTMYQKREERRVKKINAPEKSSQSSPINWFPGHMNKAKREIGEKLKLVDIVFEMLDARIPFSSRNPEIKTIVGDKPKLILLNKASLADKKETQKWVDYFTANGEMVLCIDSIDQSNVNKVIKLAREVLDPVIQKKLSKGLNAVSMRALIIGIPNSGKSTLINSLAKRKATITGDKPGVTKTNSWIKVSSDLDIMDTPGILWPKISSEKMGYNLALSGAIKDDILPLDEVVIYGFKFMDKYYKEKFQERYKLDNYDINDALSIYEHIGKLRGCIKNNEVDYERVNRLFLSDLRSDIFGGLTFDKFNEFISL